MRWGKTWVPVEAVLPLCVIRRLFKEPFAGTKAISGSPSVGRLGLAGSLWKCFENRWTEPTCHPQAGW